jgi:Na+/H+-dicarboxylate symporter
MLIGILAGIGGGALLGGFLPETGLAVQFLGKIFISFLMMIVMPLIIASMVSGIARIGDIRKLGRLGTGTIAYYLATTALAVGTGIMLVLLIEPGTPEQNGGHLHDSRLSAPASSVNLQEKPGVGTVADNREITGPKLPDTRTGEKSRSAGKMLEEMVTGLVPSNIFKAMADNDILPVITFSLLLGAALSMAGEQGKPVLDFFNGLNDALMALVNMLMSTAPVGIGALIAGRLGEAGGFQGFWPELQHLGRYAFTVITGLILHSLITLPLLLRILGKTPPAAYARNTAPALLTAFSTASSSATLPVTIECAEEKNGISKRTAGFVLPLGATLNMDGTALYEAVAVIYIAQISGITLDPAQLLIVFLTATLASIGAAGIPEAGLVTMVMVLKAVNLPLEGIALLLAIDWFLDRCRTTVNVWGDCVGARIIDVSAGGTSPE